MSVNSFSRLGSANTYDNAQRNLMTRQSKLSNLQENLTSGKRVVKASDDPTSAAQAERALNRIGRIATDQRALESQRTSIVQAESALGRRDRRVAALSRTGGERRQWRLQRQ